jgi:hypothetical protein
MGSLRDAQNQHLKDATRHTHMRLAAQLMSLFTRQLATLERHRAHVRSEKDASERDEQARRYARERAVADPADTEFEEAALDRLCQRFERRLSGKPEAAAARGRRERQHQRRGPAGPRRPARPAPA